MAGYHPVGGQIVHRAKGVVGSCKGQNVQGEDDPEDGRAGCGGY